MSPTAARTRGAALAAFFLFAAALGLALGDTRAEASLPRTDDAGLAPIRGADESTVTFDDAAPHAVTSPRFDPHLGFASSLELLAPDKEPPGFGLFSCADTCRCERTYARNNPLKYVDPDGNAPAPPEAVSETGSVVFGSLPVSGEIQDAAGALFGVDIITWKPLSGGERMVSGLALLVPFLGAAALRSGGHLFGAVLRNGDEAVDAARAADTLPDGLVVVRGGTKDLPPPGEVFSGAAGKTLEEAASGVPHGQVRASTVGKIKEGGGSVVPKPEPTRSGAMNEKHVDVCLGPGPCPFGPVQPNPVIPSGRVR